MSNVWNCPTEEQWGRYLLAPENQRPVQLARHLEECSACRVLVQGLSADQDELRAVWSVSARPDVIYLSVPADLPDLNGEPVLLAAEGVPGSDITESATLAAPGQDVLMRLVRDRRSRDIWLYIVADEPGHFSNVIVKPFGAEKEYVTDGDGRVNLGPVEWPSPEQMTAELHLPRVVFTLKPVDLSDEPDRVTELKSPGGDRIRITLIGEQGNRRLDVQIVEVAGLIQGVPLKVAVKSPDRAGMAWIRPVKGDLAEFEAADLGETIEIYLYQ